MQPIHQAKVLSMRDAAARRESARSRTARETLGLGPIESRLPAPLRRLLAEIRERAGRMVTPVNEYGFDPFGYDREGSTYIALLGALLYRYWFRTETHGIGHLPAAGPVLIVGNHAGNFAWDAAMVAAACFFEAEPPRLARGLAEYYLPTLPFMADVMARTGSVVGTPENCRQLFERGECVMVFPEGARGAIKPYSKAYQLQHFGTGFMRMALEYGVPIVPVGIVGAEESNPAIYDSRMIARLLGSPGFPIPATLPIFGLASFFVPLPVKFVLSFGSPLRFEGPHDAEDAELAPQVAAVRREIERLISNGLSRRRNWFSGV